LNCGSHQPGKSLYTTVRELVENALDSAESISELPEVEVTMYVPYFVLIRDVSSGRRNCVGV
jgi:DNA topoisomerase VI subunit B